MRLTGVTAVLVAALATAGLAAATSLSSASSRAGASASKPTYLLCLNKAGSSNVRKHKPSACAHFGPGGNFGGGVNLKSLRWSSWGAGTATARGTECGFHLPCENVSVSVRAYRRRTACGHRVYTRLRATSKHGTTTVRPSGCPGRA